jgi:hypothetical protein
MNEEQKLITQYNDLFEKYADNFIIQVVYMKHGMKLSPCWLITVNAKFRDGIDYQASECAFEIKNISFMLDSCLLACRRRFNSIEPQYLNARTE